MSGLDLTVQRGSGGSIGEGPHDGSTRRVLVVFEACESGRAAIREAAELASAGYALTVVTLAPQVRPMLWGRAGGEGPYNIAMREEAANELSEARTLLGSLAERATLTVLAGCPQPPLASWAAVRSFDLILLPFRKRTRGGSRLAKGLRRAASAEIRLVR